MAKGKTITRTLLVHKFKKEDGKPYYSINPAPEEILNFGKIGYEYYGILTIKVSVTEEDFLLKATSIQEVK